jgi:hypothetical protein
MTCKLRLVLGGFNLKWLVAVSSTNVSLEDINDASLLLLLVLLLYTLCMPLKKKEEQHSDRYQLNPRGDIGRCCQLLWYVELKDAKQQDSLTCKNPVTSGSENKFIVFNNL